MFNLILYVMKPFTIDGVTIIGGSKKSKKLEVILPDGMSGESYEKWQDANKVDALNLLESGEESDEPE